MQGSTMKSTYCWVRDTDPRIKLPPGRAAHARATTQEGPLTPDSERGWEERGRAEANGAATSSRGYVIR